jgi:formate/nitrite transporter FocA (FNT family)
MAGQKQDPKAAGKNSDGDATASKSDTEDGAEDTDERGFTEGDVHDIEESSRLNAPMIYEVLRREGEGELNRPISSLWWSGVAAGLSISFSLLAQAALQSYLPDAPWRPLITGFGYTVGFLIVVLARHQLFTENTITAVLPVASDLSWLNLARMGRLWAVVLVANFVGTLLAGLFFSFTPVLTPDIRSAMFDIAHRTMQNTPIEMFCKGIGAGFLIAAMVWLLPSAKDSHFHVIILMTYLIAIGGFTHIIAGSLEGFMLVLNAQMGALDLVTKFMLPTLLGNIIGGTLLFSLISYGQVADEMKGETAST